MYLQSIIYTFLYITTTRSMYLTFLYYNVLQMEINETDKWLLKL
jgi:hypothetical protein